MSQHAANRAAADEPGLNPEQRRLRALEGYHILDTPAETAFDRFARLASHIFEVPSALISFVDAKRQWHKAEHNVGISEISREHSFCIHTVEKGATLIIPDTRHDPRTRNNPLVVGEPYVRFYAGAPLTTPSGEHLGTLCVLDTEPRDLPSDAQQQALEDLAALVMEQLEHRLSLRRETESRESAQTLVDSAPDIIYTLSSEGLFWGLSPAFTELTGYAVEAWLGRSFTDLIYAPDVALATELFRGALAGQQMQGELRIERRGGDLITLDVIAAPNYPRDGNEEVFGFARDVTQRKQIEETFERFFDLSADLLCIVDPDGFFRRLNPSWEETLGFSRDELVAAPLFEFVHPDDRVATRRAFAKLFDGETVRGFENRYRRKDGTYAYIEWSSRLTASGDSIFAIGRDISEQRQIRQALSEAEARAVDILENTSDAFYSLDRQWRFTYLNAQAEQLLSRSRQELLGRNVWQEFPEAVGTTFFDQYHQALANNESVRFEAYYPPLHGWFEVHVYPSGDGLAVYFQNINDRREAQELLERQEQRLRKLYAITSQLEIGVEERLEGVLELCADLLGFEAAFVSEVNEGCYELRYLHAPDHPPERDHGDCHAEYLCTRAMSEDGAVLAEMTAQPHPSYPNHPPQRYLGTALRVRDRVYGTLNFLSWRDDDLKIGDRDLVALAARWAEGALERQQSASQERRYLSELEQKNQQLERASRLKSEFLANMSHELRTPLTAIMGFSEVLADEMMGPLNDAQKQYATDINSSGQHLLQLINDILDLSKIEAGKMDVTLEPLYLPQLVHDVLHIVRDRAKRKDLSLDLNIDHEVPTVRADALKVKQALLNYLSNAIKFTSEGGTVSVRLRPCDGEVCVEISDTGIGIAKHDLPRLFSDFTQIDASSTRNFEGTGLGLALTKRLIVLQGGRVWAESELGKGSTFGFALPVGGAPATTDPATTDPGPTDPTEPNSAN